MSRQPHEPNDDNRSVIRTLAASGIPQDDIALNMDISPKTLRLYYRIELDEGIADANASVAGFLDDAIRKRNVTAMIFFEKCKGGKRETIREEISGPGGAPLSVTMGGYLPCKKGGWCGRRAVDYLPGDELIGPPAGFRNANE